jgi:carbamoyl-phosphate synthase small subunit
MGIEGIDTRALTRHIRTAGAMKAVISSIDHERDSLIEKARSSPGLVGRDLVKEVTCKSPYVWSEGAQPKNIDFTVVVMDFGVKYNILRKLRQTGCKVQVVPATASPEEVLAYKPDGLLLSNGPGDPAGVPYVINTVRKLLDQLPIFGICLGHQLLGLAFGGSTYKLKFGHRGGQKPFNRES